MEHIPVVSLSKITGKGPVKEEDLIATADEVFKALSGIGFVYLSDHGVDQAIIDKAFDSSRKFFELPQEEKEKSLKDVAKSYGNGYSRPGQELLHPTSRYEHRESYDFCGKQRYYPESCSDFGPALTALEDACKPLAKHLLRIMAMSMKLEDREFFVTRAKALDDPDVASYTTFRSLYYPKVPNDVPADSVRLADHTDYGILTILFQDQIGGLQVKSVSGKWVPANPIPGTILINTGDLLEFWTGGVFPATRHQVLIPEEELKKKTHRQSIVLFVHPDDDVIVKPLIGNSDEYDVVTAKEHAAKRLASTYKY